jgi:hypothetical protein
LDTTLSAWPFIPGIARSNNDNLGREGRHRDDHYGRNGLYAVSGLPSITAMC